MLHRPYTPPPVVQPEDVAATYATNATEVVGAVVHRWLLALHQFIHYFDDDDTAFLFCARAGVRIRALYDIFRAAQPDPGPGGEVFWISRVSVAKGVYGTEAGRERAIEHLSREYYHWPLRDMVRGLLQHNPERLSGLDLSVRELDAHGFNFPGYIQSGSPVGKAIKTYLEECSGAFESYVRSLLSSRSRAVLIDSGWQGSAQSLLRSAFPDISWHGLYFGRILGEAHDPSIRNDCIGLMFESETVKPTVPETAFVRHRHLVENLLEPNAPSVEEIPADIFLAKAQPLITACLDEVPDLEADALYLGVRSYIEANAELPMSKVLARHRRAMPELARMLLMPLREEVSLLAGKPRSADFGKSLRVPVVIEPESDLERRSERRLAEALWTEGQIALEHDPAIARELQARVTGLSDVAAYFDPAEKTADALGSMQAVGAIAAGPDVAVITRTKNRPILLRRAAKSVSDQTLQNLHWVVVNDGGDLATVEDVVEGCLLDRRRLTIVSHDASQGMEAASNAGVAASDAEFVVIHDDDDSWDPTFLERTVSFLRSAHGQRYGGVITHSTYVSEEIVGDTVVEHDRRPYNDWVRNVQLTEMACGNFFPPIAFVFRRSAWEKTGGFNENLPVLGDWYFNMQFLTEYDIAVIPEPLALYHHRDRGASATGIYSNSVIGGVSKHEEFASIARNEFLRKHGDKPACAASIAIGYVQSDIRGRLGHRTRGGGQQPSTAVLTSSITPDESDRLRAIVEINRTISQRSGLTMRRLRNRVEPLSPDADWDAVVRALQSTRAQVGTPADFDEAAYLRMNVDVANAVQVGDVRSGYMHYLMYGRAEGRPRASGTGGPR